MTILHEIGHAVLGHNENTDDDIAEAEAAFFAKYAVAPPPLIDKIKPNDPQKIENIFHISYEAATYAFSYYYKWLVYGNKNYTDYEIKLLHLFRESA